MTFRYPIGGDFQSPHHPLPAAIDCPAPGMTARMLWFLPHSCCADAAKTWQECIHCLIFAQQQRCDRMKKPPIHLQSRLGTDAALRPAGMTTQPRGTYA